MDDEATFLDVIVESPDDSDVRQVYADWLEQQGDVRSEIVRLHDYLRLQTASATAQASEVAHLRGLVKMWLHRGKRGSDEPTHSLGIETAGLDGQQRRDWLDRMGIFTSLLRTDHVAYIDMQRKFPRVACRFYADWSGPCVQFQPVYREVAQRLSPWCVFLDANIDDNADWAEQVKVSAVPCIMISKQRRLQQLLVGLTTIGKLQESLEEWVIHEKG